MAVYEVKSFRGGLSDYEDKGIEGAFKFGSNLDIRKVEDTLSCQQALVDEGLIVGSPSASISPSASASSSASPSISPSASDSPSAEPLTSPSSSRSPSASSSPSASVSPSSSVSPSLSISSEMTSVFRGLIHWFVRCTDGLTYGFDNTGRIYKRTDEGVWAQVYLDPDGKITGAAEWPNQDGTLYLFWATRTSLKRKPIPGLSDWNDVETVGDNLTSNDWHSMREAGGSLVIANAQNLALVGYDGSYTNNALDLIPGNLAKTIVERSGRTIVGTVRAANPTNGVNAAIDAEVPIAQVGNDGELFYADMTSTTPIKRLPGGGQVNPGGIANEVDQAFFFEWEQTALSWIDKQSVGNMALLGVYNADSGKGGVYKYGRKNRNHPLVLNLDYLLDVDEIGAVINVDGTTLISYRDGSSFGVKAVDPDNKAQAIYEGLDFKAPVKKPINITNWKYAEVFCDPLPANCSIQFKYKIDKNGEWLLAQTADGQNSFTVEDANKAVFSIGADGQIFEPQLILNPSGNNTPEIHRLRIYFN